MQAVQYVIAAVQILTESSSYWFQTVIWRFSLWWNV